MFMMKKWLYVLVFALLLMLSVSASADSLTQTTFTIPIEATLDAGGFYDMSIDLADVKRDKANDFVTFSDLMGQNEYDKMCERLYGSTGYDHTATLKFDWVVTQPAEQLYETTRFKIESTDTYDGALKAPWFRFQGWVDNKLNTQVQTVQTLDTLKSLIGQNVYKLEVTKDGQHWMTINFQLKVIRNLPFVDVPPAQYVYFDPNESLTVSFPTPVVDDGATISYTWMSELLGGEKSGGTSYTLTSTQLASVMLEDSIMCFFDVTYPDGEQRRYDGIRFILMNQNEASFVIPNGKNSDKHIQLYRGDSFTISYEAPINNDPSKELEYYWTKTRMPAYIYRDDVTFIDNNSPTLTITNTLADGAEKEEYLYTCWVRYKGENQSFYYLNEYQISQHGKKLTVSNQELTDSDVAELSALTGVNVQTADGLENLLGAKLEGETDYPVGENNSSLMNVQVTLPSTARSAGTPATGDDFGAHGMIMRMSLPADAPADYWNYDFTVAHLFESVGVKNYQPGDIDYPEILDVSKDGLKLHMYGASPVMVSWTPKNGTPAAGTPDASVPNTGDSTPLALLGVLMALSAVGMVCLKKKLHA